MHARSHLALPDERSRKLPVLILAGALFAIPMPGLSQNLRIVAATGTPAPAAGLGVTINAGFSPVINDAGRVAFNASLAGPNVTNSNRSAIYIETGAGLALVARAGNAAPGAGSGAVFDSPSSIVINNAGQIAFVATVTGTGVTGDNNDGTWAGTAGNLRLVVRESAPAPGPPAGLVFNTLSTPFTPLLDGLGKVAFFGDAVSTTNRYFGYWQESAGVISTIAIKFQQAPTFPAGVLFTDQVSRPVQNDAGRLAFATSLNGAPANADQVIWSNVGGSLQTVVRENDRAPGTPAGIVFNSVVTTPVINNAGQLAFLGEVRGSGVDNNNNQGIWSTAGGALHLIAREAAAAPGGGVFSELTPPVINRLGETAFTGFTGVWAEEGASLQRVATAGQSAPGTAAGVTFVTNSFDQLVFNGLGQTAFKAMLTGPGVTIDNDIGLWAQDSTGLLRRIAREGDSVEISPGVFRTLLTLAFLGGEQSTVGSHSTGTGNEDGRQSGFNDVGDLAFAASFIGGGGGVFVSRIAAVPEPSTMLLAASACAALGCRRRRR